MQLRLGLTALSYMEPTVTCLNQFYSPLFNKREDEFGGSLEKRMRFPFMVAKRVRERLGSKLLLYRLGSDDLAPHGTHIEDSVVFAKRLEAAGVDIIDVSGGMCGSEPRQLRQVKGYFVPQASEIKKAVNDSSYRSWRNNRG